MLQGGSLGAVLGASCGGWRGAVPPPGPVPSPLAVSISHFAVFPTANRALLQHKQ